MVVIINEEFARRSLRRRSIRSAGTFCCPGPEDAPYPAEIVGIVGNSRHRTIGEAQKAADVRAVPAARQSRPLRPRDRPHANGSRRVVHDVQQVLGQMDPSAADRGAADAIGAGVRVPPEQLGAALLGVLGALGLALAMVGLYAVMSYAVSRRTAEIGIRMALGATRHARFLDWCSSDAALLAGAGIVIGLAIASLVTQPLAMFLVAGLSPGDPVSFAGTALVLILVSLAAAWTPARRARASTRRRRCETNN